jgi:hypothetical protein
LAHAPHVVEIYFFPCLSIRDAGIRLGYVVFLLMSVAIAAISAIDSRNSSDSNLEFYLLFQQSIHRLTLSATGLRAVTNVLFDPLIRKSLKMECVDEDRVMAYT